MRKWFEKCCIVLLAFLLAGIGYLWGSIRADAAYLFADTKEVTEAFSETAPLAIGCTGSGVMEIKALLKKMGYDIPEVDDIYDETMAREIVRLQKNYGIAPDGKIGKETIRVLERYLLGYTNYTIQSGDNLYQIANKYSIDVALLLAANPKVDPIRIQLGQTIVIPYSFDVVDTNIAYTYDAMERDMKGLAKRYPFIEVGTAGKSAEGRNLYYIKMGNGPNKVFYNGTHHGLEWITSMLLMKFSEAYAKAYALNSTLSESYYPRDIWEKSTIYIIPMVNPDGVNLVLNGLAADCPGYTDLISWNGGSNDFSARWQANSRGVDLNHNYEAGWEESKSASLSQNITGPAPSRFPGSGPLSEPETQTMVAFARQNDFRLVLAFHSQGEVIFWDYDKMATDEARQIGEHFAQLTGYQLAQADGIASSGGFKDWFIKEYNRPAYTVEVGDGINPLPLQQFDTIYEQNIRLLMEAAVITG